MRDSDLGNWNTQRNSAIDRARPQRGPPRGCFCADFALMLD